LIELPRSGVPLASGARIAAAALASGARFAAAALASGARIAAAALPARARIAAAAGSLVAVILRPLLGEAIGDGGPRAAAVLPL
jgi:hypothetical protein